MLSGNGSADRSGLFKTVSGTKLSRLYLPETPVNSACSEVAKPPANYSLNNCCFFKKNHTFANRN